MSNRTYTKEEFIDAVKTSTTVREALKKLKLSSKGGNYASFHKYVKELDISISHFKTYNKGQCWNRNIKTGPKRPIEDYLQNKFPIQSNQLKKRLLKEKIFEYKCYKCNNRTWNNDPIPLELEHINGNHNDNSIDNLTLLCPNCHAQTETYRGKNIKATVAELV